jgi:hypothetical protein
MRRPLTITDPTDATLIDPPIVLNLTTARFADGGAAVDSRDLRADAGGGALPAAHAPLRQPPPSAW